MPTIRNILLIVAIVLFVYAGALVDHGDDLWGNVWVVMSAGLACFAAAHLGYKELD